MANGIHESLISLAVDIDALTPLDGNPRRGDVDAIMASYKEFGQIKPIVVRPNSDGTATVIAGNHQLEAAKRLGWDKIAAVKYDVNDQRAIAFALADNRTMELGYTEPELLEEVILELSDYYPELIEGLGWDEFSTAEIEQKVIRQDTSIVEPGSGFIPPVVTTMGGNGFTSHASLDAYPQHAEEDEPESSPDNSRPSPVIDRNAVSITNTPDGKQRIDIRPGFDQNDVAIRGSTIATPGAAPQAVVQYTIVFDNPSQQARWYEFIKWLRSDAAVVGSTTAERLIDFIEQHTDF